MKYGIRYISCGEEYEGRLRFATYEEALEEVACLRSHGYVSSLTIFEVPSKEQWVQS